MTCSWTGNRSVVPFWTPNVPNLIACPSDPSLAAADLQIAADDPDPQGRALRLRRSLSDYARGRSGRRIRPAGLSLRRWDC